MSLDEIVLFRQHGPQIQQQPIAFDARDDRRRETPEPFLEAVRTDAVTSDRNQRCRQLDARRAAAANGRHAVEQLRVPAVYGIDRSLQDAKELIADGFAALDATGSGDFGRGLGEAPSPLKSLAQYLVERKN